MIGADIKKVLFQEEVEMKPTSLVRSAEEDNVRYKNNSLQKEAHAQQVYFFVLCFRWPRRSRRPCWRLSFEILKVDKNQNIIFLFL